MTAEPDPGEDGAGHSRPGQDRSAAREPGDQQPVPAAGIETVEQLIRTQLAAALGGPRGIIEAAVPTATFTLCYVISDALRPSLIIAVTIAVVLLIVRLIQRSSIQFVLNAAIGIGIAAIFAARSGRAEDAFLPGILYNAAYTVVLTGSVLLRWPLVGFMVGAVTGDPTGWRADRAMVRLCSRLTLLLALPCALRVLVQYPLYEAGEVGLLGTAKIAMGWPLQVGALVAMGALLARGRTPLEHAPPAPGRPSPPTRPDPV